MNDTEYIYRWLSNLHKVTWPEGDGGRFLVRKYTIEEYTELDGVLGQNSNYLIFDPQPGRFGLGVKMCVFELAMPACLIVIDDEHLVDVTQDRKEAHAWFSKWIYTDRNRELRDRHRFSKLHCLEYYDY